MVSVRMQHVDPYRTDFREMFRIFAAVRRADSSLLKVGQK
jgi:hypothetical protein